MAADRYDVKESPRLGRRVTITDIASAAGVSTASVSYALNDKPGLSDPTRARILAVARRLAWEPDAHARTLAGTATDAYGLVWTSPLGALEHESFPMQFIAGLELELREHRRSLLLRVEPDPERELAVYRSWAARRQVDGVIVLNLTDADPRLALLDELGLPVVLAGEPDRPAGRRYVYADDVADMRVVLAGLAALGYRDCAHVVSTGAYVFGERRHRAYLDAVADHGLRDVGAAAAPLVGEREVGAVSVRLARRRRRRPEVIIYDSDILAVWGQRALQAAGVDDLGVVAFDDSAFCRYVTPAITALDRHPRELGRLTAQLAVQAAGPRVRRLPAGVLNVRSSTRPRRDEGGKSAVSASGALDR